MTPLQTERSPVSTRRADGEFVEELGGRVLLIEPYVHQRAAMQQAVCAAGCDVRAEAEGARIERLVREFAPHVAVLNSRQVRQPCGYVMTRVLRRTSDLPILLIVRDDDPEEHRLFGLDSGVDQVMTEPFAMEELVARVAALLRRAPRSTTQITLDDLVLDAATRTATREGRRLELTPREFDLLLALARNRGRVVSKQMLATAAWGDGALGTTSVPVHMNALRRKVEVAPNLVIHTVRGVGYLLET